MPVPLKHMYSANILRAEFTIFVPLLYTIIKPQLSFFKNRSENGMLSSTVLSYSPLMVKWSYLLRSPQIFLVRLFTENTVIPYVTHEKKMCAFKLYTKLQHSRIFFNSSEAETTI